MASLVVKGLRINSMSNAGSNCSLVQFTALRVLLIKNTTLSLINTTALFVFISHHKSVETKCLRLKQLKGHANFSCDDTLALYSLLLTPALGCSSIQRYSKLNEHSSVTAKHVPSFHTFEQPQHSDRATFSTYSKHLYFRGHKIPSFDSFTVLPTGSDRKAH